MREIEKQTSLYLIPSEMREIEKTNLAVLDELNVTKR